MLGDEHQIIRACGFRCAHPLLGIELRGIENFRIGGAVAPFAIHESVRAEVNEDSDFQILPGDLLRPGLHVGEILRGQRERADWRDAKKSENGDSFPHGDAS